ncbi:MAG: tetratricopeptide repeat protein, partial [Alphaproteobacteria bacterium]|nr:tetratricopeptide repeat protein [Alphaproteobacteria bacterium]
MNSISTKIYLLCQFFIITGLYAGSSVESAPKNANHQAVLSERPFNIEYLVEEVIMNKGQADGMQFYNLDSLGASLKGFSSHYLKILYDLCPHTLISAFDLGQLSDHEKTALFAVLPMLPQDIRESTTPLIISLFVLSAGALCRMNHIYIYATHPKMSDDTPPDAKQNFAIEHIFQPEKLESDHEHFACLQNFLLEEDRIVRGISFEQERDSKQLHIVRLFKSYEDYFQYFADRGIIRAALMCGILKLSSGKNPEDDKEALTYFQKAAKFEDAHGQYYVGLMHYNGYGIRRDKNIAYEYFKRSAESGNIPAMYELAQLLDRGEGCTIDRDEATRY